MGNSCFGVGHGPMGLCYTEVSSVKKKKKMLKRVCSKTAGLMEKNGSRLKIAMMYMK